jgi:hypothetical protein
MPAKTKSISRKTIKAIAKMSKTSLRLYQNFLTILHSPYLLPHELFQKLQLPAKQYLKVILRIHLPRHDMQTRSKE